MEIDVTTAVVAYYVFNAAVAALPSLDEVQNLWAKAGIKFVNAIAGNFKEFLKSKGAIKNAGQ